MSLLAQACFYGGPMPMILPRALGKVVLIDDQRMWRLFIRDMLQQCGVNAVQEFREGGQALQALLAMGDDLPDLIICDLHMGESDKTGMNGLEFCHRLRREMKDKMPPIIMMTGEQDRLLLELLADVGAKAIINKPITAESFTKGLRAALS